MKNRFKVFSTELRTSSDAERLGKEVDEFLKDSTREMLNPKRVERIETVIAQGFTSNSVTHKPVLTITVFYKES